MALNTDALTTVEALRTHLQAQRTDSTTGRYSNDLLESLINQVSSRIGRYVGRRLKAPASDETHTLDGDGTTTICCYRAGLWPIVSITSITNLDSSETIPARASVANDGYVMGSDDKLAGIIRLDGYVTDRGIGTVQIVGRFGYDATIGAVAGTIQEAIHHRQALDDLEMACLDWCGYYFQARVPSLETLTLDGVSMVVREQAVPTRVRAALDRFRVGAL